MAQSKTPKAAEFDSLVVGGGLAGLIAANQLEATGRRVALIEALDTLGGSCRPVASKAGPIDHGLKFFPAGAEAEEALAWLSGVLDQSISYEVVEVPPITYDDGKFKPFVGFGEQKVETALEIDAYARGYYLRLNTTPRSWVPRLIESFTGAIHLQSYVTKMQVDDEFVIELLINGSKRISAREVVFCAGPQQLTRLLPESHVPARLRQKLLRGEFWTSVNLDLIHGSVITESAAAHVLKGANEEPCVGLFHPPLVTEDGSRVQVSQWLTLVSRDTTDDSELVASALKQIKRQIKRAYESSLEHVLQERIVVNPTSHGDLTGVFGDDGRWLKLQNLWLVSGFMDPSRNVLGSIKQVRRTLAAIAGEPAALFDPEIDLASAPQPNA